MKWKTSLVHCFWTGAYKLCSSWSLFTEVIDTLRFILVMNSYPFDVGDESVQNFGTSLFLSENTHTLVLLANL